MKKKPVSETGTFNPRVFFAFLLCCIGTTLAMMSFAATPAAQNAVTPEQALAVLESARGADIAAQVSRTTGAYNFVKAPQGNVLAPADKAATPQARAMSFLANHGALVGMTAEERSALAGGATPASGSDLRVLRADTDKIGMTHVRMDQFYQGLRVFGAQVIVHENGEGITAVNGQFVPNINVSTTAALSQENAGETALVSVRKDTGAADLAVKKTELAIYPAGLLEGTPVQSRLAYSIEVEGAKAAERVWVDAQTGGILARIPLRHEALNRIIYSPQYRKENPELFVQRKEGDAPHPTPFVNNLYDFAGQTYNAYASGFGRDSYDGAGLKMISVYLINEQCPNAYWNGESTNYCPAFDADDVVSHEWSHAYTQFTHDLIYAFQSGALNEGYSDIFGETVDLLNGADGIGGSDNSKPFSQGGQRWLVGEDLGQEAQELLLRDMYDPDRLGDPGKVSSPNYACGTEDGGGVHTNSGVPNHAFALIVDGTQFKPADAEIGQAAGTYNGQTITGIGLNKAGAIYYRAETVYQTPTTGFSEHDTAIQTSCSDLIGQTVNTITTTSATGAPSGEVITANDCAQIAKAMIAVEMSAVPPCAYGPLLNPNEAPVCRGSATLFSEDWENGGEAGAAARGWTKTSQGGGVGTGLVDWEIQPSKNNTRFFKIVSNLRGGRTGSAAFAIDPPIGEEGGGTCTPGGDFSGSHTLDSPAITIPAGATAPQLMFDHYIASEAGVDGGQVEISKDNGQTWSLLPQDQYVFNAPNVPYNAPPPAGNNTNPNPSEFAWTGTNLGSAIVGSWGTTVVNLGSVAQPGDTIKLRWTWSQDGCNGVQGWYVDNIRVFNCPNLQAPVLSTGSDYQNPDPDGSFTMNWTRPAGASGPDTLQVSQTSCGPLLADNAEAGPVNWTIASTGTDPKPMWKTSDTKPKPGYLSRTFYADPVTDGTGTGNDQTTLTYNSAITIPSVGTTSLRFKEFYFNEDDDRGFVEVSTDNGTNWTAIYTNSRPMGSLPDQGTQAFATEGLVEQNLDLTVYSGQSIRLRFRYALGVSNFTFFVPFGWYVDDIVMENDNWNDVAVTSGTSAKDFKGTGSYCYRVRSLYTIGTEILESPVSNIVNVTVAPGVVPVVSRKVHGGSARHDVALPPAGNPGVESRRGNGVSQNSHQVVFQFPAPTTFSGASVTPAGGGTAEVESVVANGNEVAVNLRNVSDAQLMTVTLLNANSGSGATNISVPMGVLLGDTTGDGNVNVGDAQQTRNRSGQLTDASNFRSDFNADGSVNSGDAVITRGRSGNSIFPQP